MNKVVYVLTDGYNDYDQHGEYFVAVFDEKPSAALLMQFVEDESVAIKLLETGGGRDYPEYHWYNLFTIDPVTQARNYKFQS